jgi:hypothetical protein
MSEREANETCRAKHCDRLAEYVVREQGKCTLPNGGPTFRCEGCVSMNRRIGYEVEAL